ncbi:MAG: hypothetical protein L0Z62_06510 [Gemmataceae bacterium]|nr:hypothetical protein [Gemmataceae bacterium]
MLTSLLLAVAAQVPGGIPFAPQGEVSAKLEGKAQLQCDTRWHRLKLELQPQGRLLLRGETLTLFRPPAQVKPGHKWERRDAALLPLVRVLHAVPWAAAPAEQPRYDNWKGSMPRDQRLAVTGTLTLKVVPTRQGHRIEFSGELSVTDSGFLGNRFGPNWWRDQWTHRLSGALDLNDDGAPVGFELSDPFKVEGNYYTEGTQSIDPNTRSGVLKASSVIVKPLSAEQVKKARELIGRLADKVFATREQAARQLTEMGAAVVPLLRGHGLAHPDEEVRRRVRAILARLGED